jgi:hypothetical protein
MVPTELADPTAAPVVAVPTVLAEAVMVDPFRPKEMPPELLNTTDPRFPLVVPAEKFTGAAAAVPAENTSVLLEPLMVRFAPPEKCQRLPCRLEVVPDVFPVRSHA